MSRVYVDVEIEIEEFDDEEVLRRALEIIQAGNQCSGFRAAEMARLVHRIKLATNLDEDSLPPPSTAAKVRSMGQLQALLIAEREAT